MRAKFLVQDNHWEPDVVHMHLTAPFNFLVQSKRIAIHSKYCYISCHSLTELWLKSKQPIRSLDSSELSSLTAVNCLSLIATLFNHLMFQPIKNTCTYTARFSAEVPRRKILQRSSCLNVCILARQCVHFICFFMRILQNRDNSSWRLASTFL